MLQPAACRCSTPINTQLFHITNVNTHVYYAIIMIHDSYVLRVCMFICASCMHVLYGFVYMRVQKTLCVQQMHVQTDALQQMHCNRCIATDALQQMHCNRCIATDACVYACI
jgi:hypothetical protein